jgi:tetratricopeptide (TPR) repeat protein
MPYDNVKIALNHVQGYVTRGTASLERDWYDRAIAGYDKATALNPRLSDAYTNRAIARFQKNDYDEAWADIQRCQQAGGTPHPGFIEALRKASGGQE